MTDVTIAARAIAYWASRQGPREATVARAAQAFTMGTEDIRVILRAAGIRFDGPEGFPASQIIQGWPK